MTLRARRAAVARAARLALFVGASASAFVTSGCGGGDRAPATAARREITAQWQDVFDGTPELYVVVRPQAIRRDAVYGSLFKSLMRIAQARSEMRGVTSLEAMEGCEEIIVGVRRNGQGGDDAAMIFRGVPANLDAEKMTNAGGQPLLRRVDTKAKIPEYEWTERQHAQENGALFVLPDRTWIGAMGDARIRARQAFAAPFGRPSPKTDPEALASIRVDAAAFLSSPRLTKSALVGPLTKKLNALTIALKPGKLGVVASLQYEDEDASAWAEMHAKRILEQIAKQDAAPGPEAEAPGRPPRPGRRPEPRAERFSLAWIKEAQVAREASTVVVKLPVPARLLEELPNASGADLPL